MGTGHTGREALQGQRDTAQDCIRAVSGPATKYSYLFYCVFSTYQGEHVAAGPETAKVCQREEGFLRLNQFESPEGEG